MTGYFSSLIRQTGITFRPDSDSNSEVLESPHICTEGLNKTTPIHVLEERVVEPPASENNNIHYIEEKILIKPQTDKFAGETNEDIKAGFKHSELHAGSNSNQYLTEDFKENASGKFKIEREKPKRRLLAKCDKNYEKMLEKKGIAKSVSQECGKNLFQEHGINLNDQLTREQIWKNTFKEVREWVAETPDKDIEELSKSNTFNKTIDAKGAESGIPSLSDQRLLSTIPEPGYGEKQEKEKTEIHDFYLSIGTISLTIEEPNKEIQSYKPVQIRRDERSMKESGFSRLSRHYIRI
jgi:hypothetical protein